MEFNLLRMWKEPISAARVAVVFAVGIAVLCGLTVITGAVPTRIYGHDTMFLLDNGWKALNGVRPHLDYYSPWGPVMFLTTAAGLALSGHSVNGIGYGNALMALAVGTWAFFLGSGRLTAAARLLVCFYLAALVAAPYSLGNSPFASSHAMVYNRYGFAFLGLVLVEAMVPADLKYTWTGGFSTGAVLGILLFLKASYFLVAGTSAVLLPLLMGRSSWRRVAGIAVGGGLVGLAILSYLRFDIGAILGDLRMAAGARGAGLTPDTPVWNTLNHASIALLVVLFCLSAIAQSGMDWRMVGAGLFLFAADIMLMSTNAQSDGFPMCGLFAIVMLSRMAAEQTVALFCLGAALFVPPLSSDLAGIGYGAWKKLRPSTPNALVRFSEPVLRPLLLYDGAAQRSSNGSVYTTYVNDGVALLKQYSQPEDKVLTMDMSNPFPYALQRKPPRAGVAAMTYHITMNDQHRPSDERYFGDASIVMVPKHPAEVPVFYDEFLKAYEPGLRERFKLVAEDDWWWMYRRK